MKPRQPRYGDIFAGHDEGEAMAEMARVLWAGYGTELEERGLFKQSRANTLDRLVRAAVEYHHMYPMVIAEGPVSKSEKGGEFFSYRWSAVQKLSDQILKLEAALTLTPMSVGAKVDDKPPAQTGSAASKYLERSKTH